MRTIVYAVFAICTCIMSCSRLSPKPYVEYKTAIALIKGKVVDLTSADDLFTVTNFVELYEKPNKSLASGLAFLKDESNEDETKMIVIYSLQRLSLQKYVELQMQLLELASEKKISIALFNRALFPGLEWSTKLQRDYRKKSVKKLLVRIAESRVTSDENRVYIKEILSGDAWKRISDFQRGSGEQFPR